MRPTLLDKAQCPSDIEVYDYVLTKSKTLFIDNFNKTFSIAEELFEFYAFNNSSGLNSAELKENKLVKKSSLSIYDLLFG